MKKGMVLTTILRPSFAPFKNETFREYVFGKRMLLPITIPAQPAITITEISMVPCNQTLLEASKRRSRL